MAKPIQIEDDFASAMQQLSAQASQSLSTDAAGDSDGSDVSQQLAEAVEEFRALSGRIDKLESALGKRIDNIAAKPVTPSVDFVQKFQSLDEQLAAIRTSETVTKRLFDSLHEEMAGYRDNFLHESLQKPFIRDLIVLFDDLSAVSGQLSAVERDSQTVVTHTRQNLDNAIHALIEILHRLEVKEIEPKDVVDRAYHKVVSYEPAEFQEDDGAIIMRLKRGFMWRDRLLRPEEVIARRFE